MAATRKVTAACETSTTHTAAVTPAKVAATATTTAHVRSTAAPTTVTAATATATVCLGTRHKRRSRYRESGQHSEGPGENSCTLHLVHRFTPSRHISRGSRGIGT